MAAASGRGGCNSLLTLLGIYALGKLSGGLGGIVPDEDDGNDANDPVGGGLDRNAATGSAPKADASGRSSLLSPPSFPTKRHPLVVSAQVLLSETSKLTPRACTLPSYVFGIIYSKHINC